ncbi:MAG: LysM peptidoglycan-binding domain-containing protein [Acetatifactor sp.]|nr:LysM peptidoglycan-binding domain-containing protein [Acetatifactor sp.]
MFTQIMGTSDVETDGMEIFNKPTQVKKAKIIGTDSVETKITDREWRHDRRVQSLNRERRQKFLTVGLALAVIICMFLICAISYSSIKAQANTGFKYYTGVTVEKGETLWSIADRYIDYEHYEDKNAYITEIQNINHLDNDETILAGQLLIVPYYSMEYIP